jgi:hypothetical protein
MISEEFDNNSWWVPLWEFAVHILVGTCIFLMIASVAVCVHKFVHWLLTTNPSLPIIIIIGLKICEYILFECNQNRTIYILKRGF